MAIGALGLLSEAAMVSPLAHTKQREKKRRYGSGGKAFTKGRKYRSLKSRSNRLKAKRRV